MPARLAKVTCPHCGAPIRVEVTSQFTACEYCKRTSFVHQPTEPVAPAPAGYEGYGHIQLPRSAVRSPLLLPLLIAFFGFDLLVVIGVVVALIVARSPSSAPAYAPAPTVGTVPGMPTLPGGSGGPACQQLARCCRALQADRSACDMMAALPEQECAKNLPQMQQAVRAMGRSCD